MYLKLVKMGNCLCVFDHNFLKERKKDRGKCFLHFILPLRGVAQVNGQRKTGQRPVRLQGPRRAHAAGVQESGFGPGSASGGPNLRKYHSQRDPRTQTGGPPQESCTEPPGERALGTRGRDNGQQTGSVMRLCEDRAEARTPCGIRNLCGLDCG